MAIAFRAAGAVATGDSITSKAFSAPAGVLSTDVVLLSMVFSGGSGTTITPPTGWTLAVRTNNGTTDGQATYWALGTVSFANAFTFTSCTMTGFALAYSGVDTTTPMDATAVG